MKRRVALTRGEHGSARDEVVEAMHAIRIKLYRSEAMKIQYLYHRV
jgi:hypothetical protein